MRNFRKLPVPIQTAHGYPCAPVPTGGSFLNPQTLRRPLTPPPLFAPNRSSKNIAEPAQLWSLRARVDAHFPSNIGAKGSRREESRIFPKHRNAAEVDAELSETARSGTGYPRLSLCACSNRREFLNPQTPRRSLTPQPLFAPNRSSKNIAEPARLRSLRVRADAAFPSNIGTKGSRREESRIFFKTSKRRRSTCGTFGNYPFRYRLPTAIPARLFQQAGVFESSDSASLLDAATVIRAEPQFQEHRRTRTVAESPRLPPPQSV